MMLLELPPSVIKPNDLQKVLMGMPIIGPDRRAYKALRRIQRRRSEFINSLWPATQEILSIKNILDKIMVNELEWPNTFFHPLDKMNALFLAPFMDMTMEIACMEVYREFPKAESFNFMPMGYLEFIQKLLR